MTAPHYNVEKFLASLLKTLTLNQFRQLIRAIPQDLFNKGYLSFCLI